MDTSKLKELWKIMAKYTFEIDPDSINDDLFCIICKRLMVDACHSVCCCQYCYKCISEYIGDGNKYCPGGKTKCREGYLSLDDDIIRDKRINTRIYNLKVICPNDSCKSLLELKQMNQHLTNCNQETMDCPYGMIGCNNGKESQNYMLNHLQNDVLNHTELLFECINCLRNEVNELKLNSEKSKAEIRCLRDDSRMKDLRIKSIVDQMEDQKRDTIEQMKEEKREMFVRMEELKREIIEQMKENRIATLDEISSPRLIIRETKKENAELSTKKEEFGSVKSLHVKEITERLVEEKREMECAKEESLMKEFRVATLEKQLSEVKNEIELRLCLMTKETENIKVELVSTKNQIDALMTDQKINISQHMAEVKKKVVRVKNESLTKENRIENLEVHIRKVLNDMELRLSGMIDEKENNKRAINDQREAVDIVKNYVITTNESMQLQFNDLKDKISEVKETSDSFSNKTERKLKHLITLCPSIEVDFIWRVDGWMKKRETMRATRIFSEPFYSKYYKMCLYMWIDNYGCIVLRCMIMKGENDDKLLWPMKLAVTLSIINQDTLRVHKSITSHYDTYKYDRNVFDRPKNDMNDGGIGSSSLFDASFTKEKLSINVNDSIVVACVLNQL